MTISPTESTPGMFGGASSTAPPKPAMSDEDTFLKLMVAQLKYQDPMNPTDSSEFLSQSAQFSALEQMTTVAEQSAQSIVLQLAFGASSLVGKTVTYVDAKGVEVTTTVNAVRFDPTGPVLQVGQDSIGMGDVVTVHNQPPATTPTGPAEPTDPTDPTEPAEPGTAP